MSVDLTVRCDGTRWTGHLCTARLTVDGGTDARQARHEATVVGWTRPGGRTDLCPACTADADAGLGRERATAQDAAALAASTVPGAVSCPVCDRAVAGVLLDGHLAVHALRGQA